MIEILRQMIVDKAIELKEIEAVMVEKYKRGGDYSKDLSKAQMLKAEIEEASIRLKRELDSK